MHNECNKQIITDILDSQNLTWKESGDQYIVCQCLNPEHNDSNPSMYINTEVFYGQCFGCGYQVFPEFFIDSEETLEDLQLLSGYQQLKKKLEIEELVEGENIFYLPKRSGKLMEYRGLSKEIIDAAGIYKCNVGRYENRVIFPFYSKNSALRGYTSRWLGHVPNSSFPKYIHSKGIRTSDFILYGKLIADLRLDASELVVTEGVLDALILIQHGVAATPSLGFRTPSDLWVVEAIQLGVEKIILAWDNDDAGISHMKKLYKDWSNKIPTELGFYNKKTMMLYKQDKYKDFHELYTEFLDKLITHK